MTRRKRSTQEIQEEISGGITFQLSPGGMVGIGVVLFCLFFWIFLLGIWAGQTILHAPQQPAAAPPPDSRQAEHPSPAYIENSAVEIILPEEKKKRIAPLGSQAGRETQ
jgi:hypothetical protein